MDYSGPNFSPEDLGAINLLVIDVLCFAKLMFSYHHKAGQARGFRATLSTEIRNFEPQTFESEALH